MARNAPPSAGARPHLPAMDPEGTGRAHHGGFRWHGRSPLAPPRKTGRRAKARDRMHRRRANWSRVDRSASSIPNNASAPPRKPAPVFACTTRCCNNLPPSTRFGLSCQAGLLTRLHPPTFAFPNGFSGIKKKGIRLTALGTFRSCTGFRFSRPKGQAPDEEAYEQQRLQIQVSCAAMRQCDRGHLTGVLRPSAAAQTRAG